MVSVHKVSVLRRGCIERSNSRLAKAEKCEFTGVNDHLEEKHHKEVGLYRRALDRPILPSPLKKSRKIPP
ncbi:MAG: hypothetical protein CSA95_08455 [Bacteroidetes bacterium]|nr:MAG: hypothetical protein CSA95_08455 [Bacteroidota bacterium]